MREFNLSIGANKTPKIINGEQDKIRIPVTIMSETKEIKITLGDNHSVFIPYSELKALMSFIQ